MKSQKIDIILPTRIGDSILSIPALVCLGQLNQKYNSSLKIKALTRTFIVDLFSSLNLFTCRSVNLAEKFKSFISPADKAFFVETTTGNLGYNSKMSYGIENPFKKLLKFSKQPVYLSFSARPDNSTWEKIKNSFPEELVAFLLDKCGLSYYSTCYFGICLELGYSAEQIINTFNFSPDMLNLNKFSDKIYSAENGYVVFCMEAGYGRKHLDKRCWNIENYFEIANRCAADFGVKAVFVGMDNKTKLPDKDYIENFREKLNLFQLACLMKSSLCYVGNDTGPMHVANLMKKKTVAMYFKQETMVGFSPIFPELNTPLYKPAAAEEVYLEVSKILSSNIKVVKG